MQTGPEIDDRPKVKDVANLTSDHATPLLILHGSNMGSAQHIAARLAEEGESVGFVVSSGSLDEYTNRLPSDGAVLLITGSYNGTPTDDAKTFMAWLESTEQSLGHVRYGVFGVGNRDWATTYQRVPRLIEQRLETLGAECVVARGEADARGDFFGDIDSYAKTVWPELAVSLGLTVAAPVDRGDRFTVDLLTDNDRDNGFFATSFSHANDRDGQ